MRKEDTRQKILLGGLVIKAGLAGEDAAVVLGALVLTAKSLVGSSGAANRARCREAGDQAFSKKGI
jgi:hypothetical protein